MRLFLITASGVVAAAAFMPSGPIAGSLEQVHTTYRSDIARIMAAKCSGCHISGGAGPFPLTTYSEVQKRSAMILKVTHLRSMPPTQGRSDFDAPSEFPPLTNEESLALQKWIQEGTLEGTGPSPAEIKPRPKWRLGPPDLILSTPKGLAVPSEGARAFRIVSQPLPIPDQRTLIAFDIVPTTPFTTRQALVAVERAGESNTFAASGAKAERLIGAWSAGYPAWSLPDDAGLVLKPGSRLAVRALYIPTGKREDGGFEIGLYFAKTPRLLTPTWVSLGRTDFIIPGDPEFTNLEDSARLEEGSRLISVVPEARNAAHSVMLRLGATQATQRTLLDIQSWNPRWIGAYNFARPPQIPAHSLLSVEIQYRNSNHANPDLTLDEIKRLPKSPPIYPGGRESDELFWVHLQVLKEVVR